jgi:hypothetical protein
VDAARALGLPVTLRSSHIRSSDSRYVIIHPNTAQQRTLRFSSHVAVEKRCDLSLDVSTSSLRETAVVVALNWLERHYGTDHFQAS